MCSHGVHCRLLSFLRLPAIPPDPPSPINELQMSWTDDATATTGLKNPPDLKFPFENYPDNKFFISESAHTPASTTYLNKMVSKRLPRLRRARLRFRHVAGTTAAVGSNDVSKKKRLFFTRTLL